MRKTKGHDLGKGLAILAHFYLCEAHYHADVDAWHAPSECHEDVSRHEVRRLRKVWRRIKGVTGLKKNAFMRELRQRTGNDKVLYRASMGDLLPVTPKLIDRYPMLYI